MLIKVCGMREACNIKAIEMLDIDMMGFIFYPKSPRFVSVSPGYLPTNCKRVGVFVNESADYIIDVFRKYSLDYVQLHGEESSEFCEFLKHETILDKREIRIIKSFSINEDIDINSLTIGYGKFCDYFLFDTKCSTYGGSGQCFDWNLLKKYNGDTPFLLSGGINLEMAHQIKNLKFKQMAGVDLNSGFEVSPALKDKDLLRKFIEVFKM